MLLDMKWTFYNLTMIHLIKELQNTWNQKKKKKVKREMDNSTVNFVIVLSVMDRKISRRPVCK